MKTKKESIDVVVEAAELTEYPLPKITNAKLLPSVSPRFDTVAIDYENGNTAFVQWSYDSPLEIDFNNRLINN